MTDNVYGIYVSRIVETYISFRLSMLLCKCYKISHLSCTELIPQKGSQTALTHHLCTIYVNDHSRPPEMHRE